MALNDAGNFEEEKKYMKCSNWRDFHMAYGVWFEEFNNGYRLYCIQSRSRFSKEVDQTNWLATRVLYHDISGKRCSLTPWTTLQFNHKYCNTIFAWFFLIQTVISSLASINLISWSRLLRWRQLYKEILGDEKCRNRARRSKFHRESEVLGQRPEIYSLLPQYDTKQRRWIINDT